VVRLKVFGKEVPMELLRRVFSLPEERRKALQALLPDTPYPLPEELELDALERAFLRSDMRVLAPLFRAGFDPSLYDRLVAPRYHRPTLFEALSAHGKVGVLSLLLRAGYRPDRRRLEKLFGRGHTKWSVVKLLVDEGLALEDLLLVSLSHTSVVALMLFDRGYRIPKGKGGEALYRAVLGGWECVELLVAMGADPDEPGERGLRPLGAALDLARSAKDPHRALWAYRDALTLLLLGADPKGAEWREEDEAWVHAVLAQVPPKDPPPGRVFEVLEALGMLRGRGPGGRTFLHAAAANGLVEDLRRALKHLDPDSRDERGNTPLHLAAHRSSEGLREEAREEVVRALLEAGADPDPVNDWGDRPIEAALRFGFYGVALLLLEAGANLPEGELGPLIREASRRFGEERVLAAVERALEGRPGLGAGLLAAV